MFDILATQHESILIPDVPTSLAVGENELWSEIGAGES